METILIGFSTTGTSESSLISDICSRSSFSSCSHLAAVTVKRFVWNNLRYALLNWFRVGLSEFPPCCLIDQKIISSGSWLSCLVTRKVTSCSSFNLFVWSSPVAPLTTFIDCTNLMPFSISFRWGEEALKGRRDILLSLILNELQQSKIESNLERGSAI